MHIWETQKRDNPGLEFIIQAGLDKLNDYRDRLTSVPAYVISMCMSSFITFIDNTHVRPSSSVINPRMKLRWFQRYAPEKIPEVKSLFIQEVCIIDFFAMNTDFYMK